MGATYIHYGHDKFDINLFKPIKNKDFCNKPYGGLWASNTEALFGWKKWCEDNDFRECNEEKSFKFCLSEDARFLKIYSVRDLKGLPLNIPEDEDWLSNRKDLLDFEKLKEEYDVIDFCLSEDYDLYDEMYGWDCDSILVLNPEVIYTCELRRAI